MKMIGFDPQALEKELDGTNTEAGDTATAALSEEKREKETSVIFATYDRNKSGALEFDELQECLQDLGALVLRCSYPYTRSCYVFQSAFALLHA